ncbi:MAG: cell wall hydrolase [Roseburia sp.]|nr:cell wall hydrolase [Roseburia sp.]
MKKRMIALLALSLMLTACGRGEEKKETAEPVAEEITKLVQTEQAVVKTFEAIHTEELGTALLFLDLDDDECYILAKIAMAEAESEDTEGKALVMLVVLNRVWNDVFPDTVEEVVMQENQFSPVANGRYDRVEPDADCMDALELVKEGWDESAGALYFESKSSSAWHQQNLKYLFRHGNHYFYKEKEGADGKKDSN